MAAFHESLHAVATLMEKAGMADARAADLTRKFIPTCSMNDRASPARAAARKVSSACKTATTVPCDVYGSPGTGGGEEHLGLHRDVPTWGTRRGR